MIASALLLLPLVSALAQDGHNIYKDMQRGRVELESLVVDDGHPVNLDHTSHTSHKPEVDPEDVILDDSDEAGSEILYEGNDQEEQGRRSLIPRTQVLLRGMESMGKPKRGTSLISSSPGPGFSRDLGWLLERATIRLPAWYETYLDALPIREQCKLVPSRRILMCNWLRTVNKL